MIVAYKGSCCWPCELCCGLVGEGGIEEVNGKCCEDMKSLNTRTEERVDKNCNSMAA